MDERIRMDERIVAEALSRYGSVRVTVDLAAATLAVERWHRPGTGAEGRGPLASAEVDGLRALAAAVRQSEQEQIVGDFYADGEERLRVELEGHTVELHNASDRIRTPGAEPLLTRCYALADRVLPRSR